MIGIIYKLTIKAKYQIDGHKPFYIGQHWCRSVDDFLCRDYPYYGSGKIWNSFLTRLKKDYPSKWRYFIKREVLCTVTNNSQRTLDRLEEFWIKREKSHYSLRLGGCNVLWGASRKEGLLNPMKDPNVAKRVSFKLRNGSHHDVSGENNPNFGGGYKIKGDKNPMKNPEVAKRNAELRRGKKRTLEQRKRMSEGRKRIKYWWSTNKGNKGVLKKTKI